MRNYPAIFGVFCITATLAVVLLRPDPRVRFEAEVTHLEPEAALALLDRQADMLSYHDTLKLTHARLALGAGDIDTARHLFSDLLDPENPSPDILDLLSEVALLENDLTQAADLAAQAQRIRPSSARRQRLGYWYRILRDKEAEQAVLTSGAPETLTGWEVDRLGELSQNLGDMAAYETVLSVLAVSSRDDARDFQNKLIAFYIGVDRFEAAAETVLAGLSRADPDKAVVHVALSGLIEKGAIDPARGLAMQVQRRHPEIGHIVVLPFMRAGHGGIARGLQDAWLAATGALTQDQWYSLSLFAEMTGDLSGLRRALARNSARTSAAVPGDVFMQFVRYGGARALVPFREYLTGDVLEEAPLVAAVWSSWTSDGAATFAHLLRASGLPLSEWDQLIWMSVAEGLRGTGYFSRLLAEIPAENALHTRLRATVLREDASAQGG